MPDPAAPIPQSFERQRLGQFELLRRIGEGAMGAVYEAQDLTAGRRVALKILPRDLAQDAEYITRFKREFRALATLHHPNIVACYGAGQIGGYWYLAMEFVEGESVGALLKREGPLPENEALYIARDVARALAHAHGLGLVHRDIKPQNILLMPDGNAKVTDFGLTKALDDTSWLTIPGTSVGTPHYLSPEQALGKQDLDGRADLYGLGVTLFHILTGQLPFDHPNPAKVMAMHVHDAPPAPRAIAPFLTYDAERLILKLLAKEPADRYASAQELVHVLTRMIEGRVLPEGKQTPPGAASVRAQGPARGCLGHTALLAVLAALTAGVILLGIGD